MIEKHRIPPPRATGGELGRPPVTGPGNLDRINAQGRSTAFMAACPSCGHEWPVAFLPMPLEEFASLAAAARCPKGCKAGPVVGSQPKPETWEETARA